MRKILIIDADQDNLQLVKFILTSRGFDVYTHSTGLGVLEVVKIYAPNLNLLDRRLPGRSGLEISKELRQVYSVPIILISGYSKKPHLKRKA